MAMLKGSRRINGVVDVLHCRPIEIFVGASDLVQKFALISDR
jgi:hypothetical protein